MKIGIIGGSGLEDPGIINNAKEITVSTPFGNPSSPLMTGMIGGVNVVILSRHGAKHSIMPGNVNYRANIIALKQQGCTHILATTACGSLREKIKPGHFVFCDQFIDRTHKRNSTFYDKNIVCHIPMAEPFCVKLRHILAEAANEIGIKFHKKGTVITIEGPRFSTKAESKLFREWNADVVNMSTFPEAVLAREAGICYAIIAMSTDYDCWKDNEDGVNIKLVLDTMRKNADNVKKLLIGAIPKIKYDGCKCKEDIKKSIIK